MGKGFLSRGIVGVKVRWGECAWVVCRIDFIVVWLGFEVCWEDKRVVTLENVVGFCL